MGKTRLDQQVLEKLADRTKKKPQYIREQISRRASRAGISSEAAQIVWARELGISTGRFLRSLPPHVQQQIRESMAATPARGGPRRNQSETPVAAPRTDPSDLVKRAIDQLLTDEQLKKRCGRLLKGPGPYDTVVREATTILDDRLKKLGGITGYMNPSDVVGKVLNPSTGVLRVSEQQAERQGIFNICTGLTLAFRGPAHHQLTEDFTREQALKFCGFVDTLLGMFGKGPRTSEA